MDPWLRYRRAGGRGRTRARRHHGGVEAFNSPGGFLNGVPFLMLFFLATVLILAAAGDVRVMRFGMPRGRPRLARHLWRMCFALFIAAGSFFSVRERVATSPSRAVHDWTDARAADPAAVWRDVLLAVEGPRPPHVGSARQTRWGVTAAISAQRAQRGSASRSRWSMPDSPCAASTAAGSSGPRGCVQSLGST